MKKQLNIDSVDSDDLERIIQIANVPYRSKGERALWLQIYDRLAEACINGPLESGARLPGENHMAELFSVSRLTMRKALSKLQQEGQLQARKGVGIFVRQRRTRYVIDDDLRFSQSLEANASEIDTKTLELTRAPASREAIVALGMGAVSEVIRMVRLRIVEGEPIYLTSKEFPADRFPRFEEAFSPNQSVTDVYRAHGIPRYTREETRITGGFAHRHEADALGLTHRTPLMRVSSVNLDPEGRPIEFNFGRWPLSAVELVVNQRRS
ncbi:phosphonate metabolism transcriptional regulator PhnF [Phaeobacter sp. C3_T13_0]|uniref:phosphonate metabolism transcriptional regulator PhnF n=1 Tax=Phaeobacter cretensis TaxID=3342641 RepID=UPI0039BD22DE